MRGKSLLSLSTSLLSAMLLVAVTGVHLSALADTYVDPKLALSGDRFDTGPDSDRRRLVGTITNMGEGSCDVIIRINLYGASNVFLRNIQRRRNDLDSGGRWEFKIPIEDPQVQSYEIKSVRAVWQKKKDRTKRQRFS